LFDLGTPDARQLAEVAWLIEDAIDSLINMPPQGEMERMVKAEDIKASLKIDGEPVGH
jgi:hypothetical protein